MIQKITLSCHSSCCPELSLDGDLVLLTDDDGSEVAMTHEEWQTEIQAFRTHTPLKQSITKGNTSIVVTAEQMEKAIDFYRSITEESTVIED